MYRLFYCKEVCPGAGAHSTAALSLYCLYKQEIICNSPCNICNYVSNHTVHVDRRWWLCNDKLISNTFNPLLEISTVYSSVPWDTVREVDCPNKLRLAPYSSTCCADKWHAILIVRFFFLNIFYIQRIVVWNIVKVLWFKRKKTFSAETPPWGLSKHGSLRKSYFFSNPTSKYYFKDHRPHRPKSYILRICLSESQSAAQPQKRLPCGLFVALWWSKNRPDILFSALSAHAKTWWSYMFLLPLVSFTKRECHVFPISHLFNRFQFSF